MIAMTEQAHEHTPSFWKQVHLLAGRPSTCSTRRTRSSRRTDPDAPIFATHHVVIDAPVERVWEVLSHPDGWTGVDPTIRNVRLEGGVVEGARFTWRNGKAKLASRFAVVDPGHELTWTGHVMGSKVVHRHVLDPTVGWRHTTADRRVDDRHVGGVVLQPSEAALGPGTVVERHRSRCCLATAGHRLAAMIAATEAVTSASVVAWLLTEMRMTAWFRQVDPPSQHVPSCCTSAITARVLAS